jgi:hypothetical protein
MKNTIRPGGTNPLVGVFVVLFIVIFVLPALARAGGGFGSVFLLVVVGWGALQLIRVAMRAGREADHVAVPTRQVPDDVVVHTGMAEPADAEPVPPAPQDDAQYPPRPAAARDDDGYATLAARLAELDAMRDRGEITADEYERRRAEAFRTF